jgi:hypothetical protein
LLWFFFCSVFSAFFLCLWVNFPPLFFHTLRSLFIVPESLCVWETKFQSNSFSSLKFKFN